MAHRRVLRARSSASTRRRARSAACRSCRSRRCSRADRPSRRSRAAGARAIVAFVAAAAAFVFYVEAAAAHVPRAASRRARARGELPASRGRAERSRAILRWYAQPILPEGSAQQPARRRPRPLRVAGALRVFFRGLVQVCLPVDALGRLLGAARARPGRVVFPESILGGAAACVLPFPLAVWLDVRCALRQKLAQAARRASRTRDLAARRTRRARWLGASPVVVAVLWSSRYFPVSNIPVLLPTVRAERFWYFPAIGTSARCSRVAFARCSSDSTPARRRARVLVGVDPRLLRLPGSRAHATRTTTRTTSTSGTRPARPSRGARRRTSTTRS